jgi:hypothetical protein
MKYVFLFFSFYLSLATNVFSEIRITNFPSFEDKISYPIALIRGEVDSIAGINEVDVEINFYQLPKVKVLNGQFKVLARLIPGPNTVVLSYNGKRIGRIINYEILTNIKKVRLVYLKTSNHDGRFEAPTGVDNSENTAVQKIQLGGEMLQTLAAEKMYEKTGLRSTYTLMPKVEILTLPNLTSEQAYIMDGQKLYYYIEAALKDLPDRDNTKDLVIMSFSKYDKKDKKALAHTALGGGRLALFGSLSLHTWASTLEEVEKKFTDNTVLNTDEFFDDSAYRGTMWANYSTTLGATLHELGHAFDLPHSPDGIMYRDFDHVNRSFVISEPGSLEANTVLNETGWHDESVQILRNHPWFK